MVIGYSFNYRKCYMQQKSTLIPYVCEIDSLFFKREIERNFELVLLWSHLKKFKINSMLFLGDDHFDHR
jgi:hypothetical protein